MKFNSIIASVLSVACMFCALTSPAATFNVSDFVPGRAYDLNSGTLNMNVGQDFDLDGKTLTLTGVKSVTRGNVFTGSAGSVLDIEFVNTSEYSFTGSGVFLSGNLKFIKRGTGKVRMPAVSPHTGGTVVYDGIVDGVTGTTRNLSDKYHPFGVAGSTLEIAGGVVLIHAYYNMKDYYPVVLSGGCLKNDQEYKSGNVFNADIQVKADSTLESESYVFPFEPNSISGEGKLTFTGATGFTIGKSLEMRNISLVANAPISFGAYDLEVKDYEVLADGSMTGTGTVNIFGAYTPTTENTIKLVLQNDSAIDLSAKENRWTPSGSVGFAEGATITIKVGERVFTVGDYVLQWKNGMDYTDRMFVISGDKTSGLMLEVNATGLKVVAETDDIAYAVWTGAKDSDWREPANWTCYNAAGNVVDGGVPTRDTPVTISDLSKISFAEALPFNTVVFDDAFLDADVTWDSLEYVPNDLVIDLKGHKLTLPKLTETTCAATITDSVGGGIVEMNVEEGFAFTNRTLSVTGKAKIEKTGAGTFVGVLDLTNEGGFEVKEGKITPASEKLNFAKLTPFGKGAITIGEAGSLDPLGGYDWFNQTINLNGGLITNTVWQAGLSTNKNGNVIAASTYTWVFNPTINLLADSTIAIGEDFNFWGVLNANGHELKVSVALGKYFTWCPQKAENLKLNVVYGGWFRTSKYPLTNEMQPNLDFTCNAALCMLGTATDNYGGGMDVQNYTSTYSENFNDGTASLNVYGTFTPMTDYFRGCKMMNGSRIVLPATGVWSIKSSSVGTNTLTFEDDATITIDLSRRGKLVSGNRVLSWTSTTKPGNAHFVLDAETQAKMYAIIVKEDGIYLEKHIAYDLDVKDDAQVRAAIDTFFGTTKVKDNSTLETINGWLEENAGNGYRLKDCLILGLAVEGKGKCATPYLQADASADVGEGRIKFAFGGITPKTDKADITYTIESAGTIDATNWDEAARGSLLSSETTATANLPKPEAGESAVKYYKVHFSVSEKAKTAE